MSFREQRDQADHQFAASVVSIDAGARENGDMQSERTLKALRQCLRRYRDSRQAFPHLANGVKYLMACLVVMMSSLDAYAHGSWRMYLECKH
jgi:hypothetical protein